LVDQLRSDEDLARGLLCPYAMPTSKSEAMEPGQLDERAEPREQVLRVADVAPFPSDANGEPPGTGFALDESASGLCLQLETAVSEGALLRVKLRDFDGRIAREEIVRVAWCRTREGGRYNVGLEVVDEKDELLCSQRAQRRAEVEFGAK
jgi:hypothetical protein